MKPNRKGKARPRPPRQDDSACPSPQPTWDAAWVRVALYEAGLLGLCVFAAVFSPALRSIPFGGLIAGGAGLAALGCARFVFPKDPERAHELALANACAALVLIRPWVDGITFPQYNVPFLWFALVIFMLWAGRILLSGEEIRWRACILLMAGFLTVALLGGIWTVQFDATYRTFLNWWGFTALLIAAANGCRSRFAVGIVLGAFVCAAFAESIYAAWHVKYELPQIRALIEQNPDILRQHVGESGVRPELYHRLYSNRAFGTFLFANALAAFLLPAVTVSFGIAASRLALLWAARSDKAATPKRQPEGKPTEGSGLRRPFAVDHREAGVAALFAWLASFAVLFSLYFLYDARTRDPAEPWRTLTWSWILYAGIAPAGICVVSFGAILRFGLRIYWLGIQLLVAAVAGAAALYALVLTVSRGGMLALTVSIAGVIALLVWSVRRQRASRTPLPGIAGRAAVLLCVATAAVTVAASYGPGATAEEPASAAVNTDASEQAVGVEGHPITAAELLSPITFNLRLGYWRVGLRILQHYPLTGVGLGNFGVIYPRYQFLGADDVKQAHNDYLQILCETGIPGGLLFCVFWGWVLIWGARRLISTPDTHERLFLGGLYAGILAFLLHACVDFNFYNPSLATFQYLLAGLFLARAKCADPRPHAESGLPQTGVRRRVAAAALIVAALIAGMAAAPLRSVDQLTADFTSVNARLSAADFFLATCGPSSDASPAPLQLPYRAVKALIPSDSLARSFGKVIDVSDGAQPGIRLRKEGELLSGFERFLVEDRARAFSVARDAVDKWIELAKRVDRTYPHSPALALQLYQWHDLLLSHETDPGGRRRLIEACLHWSKELVRRSPLQAVNRELLGRMLWLRASIEESPARPTLYREGLEEFRRSAELYPTSHELWMRYGEKLIQFSKALQLSPTVGDPDEARRLYQEGEKAIEYAKTLPPRDM